MAYVGLVGGFVILLVSGDLLVRGAVSLAVGFGIPALFIGLTVVAFGTSAPELVVSVKAAVDGLPGLAVGNVVGSNITNILLVLGLPALIAPTVCNQPYIGRNTIYVVAASLLFIAMGLSGTLVWWEGAILFALILLFLVECGRRAAAGGAGPAAAGLPGDTDLIDGVEGLPQGSLLAWGFVVAGLVGLAISASLIVDSASAIARTFGVSEAVIGLTVVALGTSLPELATTVVAAIRGHCALAIGNVLGSNLFNILAIMGVTAMIVPLPVPESILRFDVWIMLAAALVMLPFALRHATIGRVSGSAFVAAYCLYVYYVLAAAPTVAAAMS